MDVAQALADLTEISSQIDAAVLFDADGAVQGSTLADEGAAAELARAAASLLESADGLHPGAARGGAVSAPGVGGSAADASSTEDTTVTQIEAATEEGCVFVVRDADRRIAATTVANPTVGLVFYDLKSCLRDASPAQDEPEEKPKRRTRKKADDAA